MWNQLWTVQLNKNTVYFHLCLPYHFKAGLREREKFWSCRTFAAPGPPCWHIFIWGIVWLVLQCLSCHFHSLQLPALFSVTCFEGVMSPTLHRFKTHRIEMQSHWGWKAPLEKVYYKSPAHEKSQLRWVAQAMSSWVLNISKGEDSAPSLSNVCQCLITLTIKKGFFFLHSCGISCIADWSHCFLSCH